MAVQIAGPSFAISLVTSLVGELSAQHICQTCSAVPSLQPVRVGDTVSAPYALPARHHPFPDLSPG